MFIKLRVGICVFFRKPNVFFRSSLEPLFLWSVEWSNEIGNFASSETLQSPTSPSYMIIIYMIITHIENKR